MNTANTQATTSKRKNIVICCDGTGNKFIDTFDPDNSNSNVVKLYTTLRIHKGQVGTIIRGWEPLVIQRQRAGYPLVV